MSWQTYVDSNLVGTNDVKYAAICGHDGSIWAKSENWNVTQGEVSSLLKNFDDAGSLAMSGLILGGDKFFYLSGDSSVIRGKKGANGVHIAKTKSALIIAKYEEPTQPNRCASVVEALADYLKDQGY
ncbi:Profilin [Armadillidium nasatum]|uniref:Profilin n=1 Tax=Armadillidium nasatum TaxID=96803 RepID=A0A5N5SPX7_9CRUS|nr:Profilin [Armadillidium nasatum]